MPTLIARIDGKDYATSSSDSIDLISTGPKTYHLLIDGVSHHCKLIQLDLPKKTMTLLVNGRQRTVEIRDEVDQLVDQLGLSVVSKAASNDVFAPMPGLVLDIMVAAGDEIEAGTPLLILEAMKMENVLKSEGSGKITRIAVEKGVAVDKRQLLIEIE